MSANRKIYIVGLTGGIASGKSEASRYLETLGANTLDADVISRELTAPFGSLLPAIRELFGDEVFRLDDTLNRQRLGEIIFNDDEARRKLDALMHPAIQKAMLDAIDELEAKGEALVFLVVPLLFETGMDVLCDECWLVSASREIQLERLMERDGLNEDEANARIDSQMSLEEKQERSNEIIENDKTREKMYSELQALYNQLIKKLGR